MNKLHVIKSKSSMDTLCVTYCGRQLWLGNYYLITREEAMDPMKDTSKYSYHVCSVCSNGILKEPPRVVGTRPGKNNKKKALPEDNPRAFLKEVIFEKCLQSLADIGRDLHSTASTIDTLINELRSHSGHEKDYTGKARGRSRKNP